MYTSHRRQAQLVPGMRSGPWFRTCARCARGGGGQGAELLARREQPARRSAGRVPTGHGDQGRARGTALHAHQPGRRGDRRGRGVRPGGSANAQGRRSAGEASAGRSARRGGPREPTPGRARAAARCPRHVQRHRGRSVRRARSRESRQTAQRPARGAGQGRARTASRLSSEPRGEATWPSLAASRDRPLGRSCSPPPEDDPPASTSSTTAWSPWSGWVRPWLYSA
jgi:hypothetical protein